MPKSFIDIRFENTEDLLENISPKDPPVILVLRRKAIRIFPSGERVALYENEKLGIEVSVPYTSSSFSHAKNTAIVKEEAHDDEFGEYTNMLNGAIKSGKGESHPDLVKTRKSLVKKYGALAFSHLHNAAEHYLGGNHDKAIHAYSRFEYQVKEDKEVKQINILNEAVIQKLHHIAKTQTAADVLFKNGATSRVDPATALKVVKLHSVLKPANKIKVENLVNASPDGLTKVSDFAFENLK